MKNLSEMKNDVVLKLDEEFQAKVKKYKSFMNLLSNCLSTIIPAILFDDIASYINGKSQRHIRLTYHSDGIHYNYIDVIADNTLKELKIVAFLAHDAYYDPSISFTSDDEIIVGFFDREYSRFVEWLTYDGTISTKKLVKAINDAIYKAYDTDFRKLNINEHNFEDSEYALKLCKYEAEITAKVEKLSAESGLNL